MDSEKAPALWEALMEAGKEDGLTPCGWEPDTLRLEAAMPLCMGMKWMMRKITPLETGLKFSVKMKKDHFIGKEALEKAGNPREREWALR